MILKTMFLKSVCCALFFVLVDTNTNCVMHFYALSGGQVNLTCPLQNESKSVLWTKNTTTLSFYGKLKEEYERRYNFLGGDAKLLQIKDVVKEDFDRFECYTDDAQEKYILQLHMIEIDIQSFYFNNSLYCNATGWQEIEFLWEHRSDFQEHIRYLKASDSGTYSLDTSIPDLFYQNSGQYVCLLKSKQLGMLGNSTEIDVKIQGRPVCVRPPEDNGWIYGSIGLSVNVEVFFYSVPSFNNISWLQGDNMFNLDNGKYKLYNNNKILKTNFYGPRIHLNVYSVILTIESLTKADFKHYTAHIVNTIGECNCTVELRLADITTNEGSSNSAMILYLIACSACVFIALSMNIIYHSYKRIQTDKMNKSTLSRQILQMTEINASLSTEIHSLEIGRVQLADNYSTVTDSLQTGRNEVSESSSNTEAPMRRFVIKN